MLIYLVFFLSEKILYNNNCFLFTTNSFQILKLLTNNVLNTNLYLIHIYIRITDLNFELNLENQRKII